MDYRAATKGDLAKVFRSNADRMTAEYERADYNAREVKDLFTNAIVHTRCHALTDQGQPLALVMWDQHNGAIYTAFAAKEEFFSPRYVRFCGKHVRHIQAQNGNLPLGATSFSDHERAPRWFKAIGFREGVPTHGALVYWLMPPLS